jgi:two-component system response regulator GlrR
MAWRERPLPAGGRSPRVPPRLGASLRARRRGVAVGVGGPVAVRVLVVEDHRDIAYVMALALEARGYVVERAASLREAWAALDAAPAPAALVADGHLPDGHGRDLIAEVKARWPECATVLVTAWPARPPGGVERRRQGRGPEPDAVVVKPFDPDEICDALARALAGAPRPAP